METSVIGSIGNPDRIVYTQYLMNIAGWGRTTAWRKIKEGFVPAPMYLGSSKPVWKQSVLDNWFAGLGVNNMIKPAPAPRIPKQAMEEVQ